VQWFIQEQDRGVQKSKIDQQRLGQSLGDGSHIAAMTSIAEFLTSALYYTPDADHHDILAKILEVFEEDKPGGLPKELLDIGIRSAIKAGQTQDAVRLARSGKSSVGLFNE